MIQFTVEAQIARSPTEVFAYATDPTKLATWQTNTISAPTRIVPVQTTLKNAGKQFSHSVPPYSIQVLELQTK